MNIVLSGLIRLVLTAILAVLIHVGVDLAGHWIAWWAAALIAFVIGFGGLLLLDDHMDWFH